MAKHKVMWRWEAEIEFDTDETEPDKIAAGFINAAESGLRFEHLSDTCDFVVVEVDGEHVHQWIDSYRSDEEYCTIGQHWREKPAQVVYLPGDAPETTERVTTKQEVGINGGVAAERRDHG